MPFVHVPRELLAQWEEYASLLQEKRDWFIRSLTERELEGMNAFNCLVAAFACDRPVPDVPEVFTDPQWLDLMRKASDLLRVMKEQRG